MRQSTLWIFAMVLATTLTSCDLIGGIFKAGMWVGIIIVVAVVGLILWLVSKGRR